MINCDTQDHDVPNDISEWFYFVHKKLTTFAEYLGKKAEELSLDEMILFFDTKDVLDFTVPLSNIFPPTIPIQDEFYKNVQILRNYRPNNLYWYGSFSFNLSIKDAANVYKYLKEENSLFVYADPETEKKYKDSDNIEPGNKPHPYKKSLSFFRWERIYSILTKGKHAPTNSYSYSGWCSDWRRARD